MDIASGQGSLPSSQRSAAADPVRATAPVAPSSVVENAPVVRALVVSAETLPAAAPSNSAPAPTTPADVRTLMTVAVNTPRPAPDLPEFSAIDEQVLNLARQGKPFSLRVTSGLAIPEGAQLIIKLNPGGATLLDGQAVAQLPVDVRNALSHALVRQVNPMALLQQLMALNPDTLKGRNADGERTDSALAQGSAPPSGTRRSNSAGSNPATHSPGRLPSPSILTGTTTGQAPDANREGDTLADLIADLQSLLPDLDDVLEGDGIQRFVRNSGVFFESKLVSAGRDGKAESLSDTGLAKDFKGLLLMLENVLSKLEVSAKSNRSGDASLIDALLNAMSSREADQDSSTGDATKTHQKNAPAESLRTLPTASAGTTEAGDASIQEGTGGDDQVTQANTLKASSRPTEAPTGRSELSDTQTAADAEEGIRRPATRHGTPATVQNTPAATVRNTHGLAVSQYQSVQRIAPAAAKLTDAPSPPPAKDALPVPGLELPLPLRSPSRRTSAASREEFAADLLQQTRDTLSRTTLHQLASTGHLQEETSAPKQLLSFDLPVLVNGQVQVFNTRIEREDVWPKGEESTASPGRKKEKLWTVSLGFDIEGLGPMFCQLSLITRDASLQIWSENPDTHRLTESHRDSLEKSMASFGVNLRDVACHNGLPKQVKTQLTQTLVDITT
jgi:hypothetical protein